MSANRGSAKPRQIGTGANDIWNSKIGMFGSNMAGKVPAAAANDPDTARFAVWYDVLGLDSD